MEDLHVRDSLIEYRTWTEEETRQLLLSYSARKDEFIHMKKRKFATQNIVEDLISSNILKSPVTAKAVDNKIKSLTRAFKAAIDNNNKSGAGRSIVPHMEILHEIFGDRPNIMASPHRISSFTNLPLQAAGIDNGIVIVVDDEINPPSISTDSSSTALPSGRRSQKVQKVQLQREKLNWQKEKEDRKDARLKRRIEALKFLDESKNNRLKLFAEAMNQNK